MTHGWTVFALTSFAYLFSLKYALRTLGRSGSFSVNRSLTVPLLCAGGGFEVEYLDEFEGSVAQAQSFAAGPQVDDVALDGAGRIEAVEDILVELDGEGAALGFAFFVVDRTGAAGDRGPSGSPPGRGARGRVRGAVGFSGERSRATAGRPCRHLVT